MGSFYEGDPEDDDLVAVGQSVNQSANDPEPVSEQSGSRSAGRKKTSQKPGNSRFATIGSMHADDESSDSEDEGQAFYAGGSERSGQQIIGPKKKKTNVVENLFKSAREHGAEELHEEDTQGPSRGPAFRGSGYRLGDEEGTSSERISGAPVMSQRKSVDCVLKLWKNGFSVDDGPLRDFKDPKNKEFLAAVSKGEVPQELIREAQGGEVNLNMEDHRQEDYVKPNVPVKAFTGEGHTLGSPAPRVVSSQKPAAATGGSGQSTVNVDESKPTTTIQIRLADGSRLVQKFNLTHTVSDIRRHITLSRPQYEGAQFILQTTFPNKELTNDSDTVETAKLQNAVVVQRMK